MQQKDRDYIIKAAEEILPSMLKHVDRIRKIADAEEKKFQNARSDAAFRKYDESAGMLLRFAGSLEDAAWELSCMKEILAAKAI